MDIRLCVLIELSFFVSKSYWSLIYKGLFSHDFLEGLEKKKQRAKQRENQNLNPIGNLQVQKRYSFNRIVSVGVIKFETREPKNLMLMQYSNLQLRSLDWVKESSRDQERRFVKGVHVQGIWSSRAGVWSSISSYSELFYTFIGVEVPHSGWFFFWSRYSLIFHFITILRCLIFFLLL